MKLETTRQERLYWPHHPDAQADVARAARDISTLLARNEELEQALQEEHAALLKATGRDYHAGPNGEMICKVCLLLINGEEK